VREKFGDIGWEGLGLAMPDVEEFIDERFVVAGPFCSTG
jgi:hypothetical protein